MIGSQSRYLGIFGPNKVSLSNYAGLCTMLTDIPGALSFPEAIRLYEITADRKGHVLEIGSRAGRSSAAIGYGLKEDQTLTCIDFWESDWGTKTQETSDSVVVPTDEDLAGKVEERFDKSVGPFGTKVVKLKGDAYKIVPSLQPDRFEIVFLDADHSEEAVARNLADIMTLRPKVVALHDWDGPAWPGVKRAADPVLGDPSARVDNLAVWYLDGKA